MPRRPWSCAVVAAACALGCRTAAPRVVPDDCPAGFPTASVPFEADTAAVLAALIGDFTFVSVRTTPGLPATRWDARLALRPTPAAERRYRRAIAPGTEREQPLTGFLQSAAGVTPGAPTRVWRLRGRVLVPDEGAACNDCGASVYRVERVGAGGFAGTWNATLGGVTLVGPGDRLFDRVGGRFCARRDQAGAGPR